MASDFPFVRVRILADDLLLASEFPSPPGFDPEEAASQHTRALDRTVKLLHDCLLYTSPSPRD
eukprot:8195971-Alexandrium_andersonii.AAC.1